MTSSWLETLGRKQNEPVSIKDTNYMQTEADLVEGDHGVNAQIDQFTKDLNRQLDLVANAYNEQYKRDAKFPQELLKFAKGAKEVYFNAKEFARHEKEYKAFTSGLANSNVTPNAYVYDKDINAQNKAELESNLNKQERVTVSNEAIKEGDVDTAQVLRTANATDLTNHFLIKSQGQLVNNFDGAFKYMRSKFILDFKEINPNVTEETRYRPASEATTIKEKQWANRKLLHLYLYTFGDFSEGRRGRWKRDVVIPLAQKLLTVERGDIKSSIDALTKVAKTQRADDLKLKLKNNPGYFVDFVNIYKDDFDGSYALAKQEAAQIVKEAASVGVFNEGDVRKIIDHEFLAHDSTPEKPHMVSIGGYWPKEAATMMNGVRSFQKELVAAQKADTDAKNTAVELDILGRRNNQKTPITIEQLKEDEREYMSRTGITDPTKLPDSFKNRQYAGMEDDIEHDALLTSRYLNGLEITKRDIGVFEDPDLKEKWLQKIPTSGGLAGAQGKRRDTWIIGQVNHKTSETQGTGKDKTREWRAYNDNATRAFNAAYAAARANGATHEEAFSAGQNAVKEGLKGDAWETWGQVNQDLNQVTKVNEAKAAIIKDPAIINSATPLPGEEAALKEAAENYKAIINGEKLVPIYYTLFPNIRTSPLKLMKARLEATGLLKGNEIIIPEDENLTSSQAQLLLNKPSASKTYRVTQENEELDWMLDTVKDKKALKNGGYDAIRDPNGDYVQLAKPLSQHTAGEVLQLVELGFTDLGMYGLTPSGFMEVLQSTPITLNTPFDQHNQDLLILARLRQKSQQAQKYSTINDQYRRLVNIDQKDVDEFLEIVGDLPPYLQLNNLLPAVATEMVKQTLQPR